MQHLPFQKNNFTVVFFICLVIQSSMLGNTPSLRASGICFTENKGQVSDTIANQRPDILYTGDAGEMSLFIRTTGVSYVLHRSDAIPEEADKNHSLIENLNYYSHRIDLDFVNCNSNLYMENMDEVEGYKNFYYPNRPEGIHNVKSYNRLTQKNIYNKIDVVYNGSKASGLEYDFHVNPGGNPKNIKMKYSGIDGIEIADGELRIKNSLGEMTEQIPRVYQEINGKIIDIKTKYILEGDIVGFDISNYDHSIPLVIDPWITYFGGASDDISASITTDTQGNAILSERTQSGNTLPILGAFQNTLSGQFDAFVTKMDANGTLKWSTFYGGTSMEVTAGIFADKNNDILFTGYTSSNNFPTGAAGGQICYMNSFPGPCAFVVKFTSSGTRLWSTFYGSATGYSEGNDITTDNNNNVIVYGYTSATNNIATAGAFQQTYGGGFFFSDAFVVKFSSTGNLSWGTYVGGSLLEKGTGVCCDASNNIYITGITNSTNFPISAGAHQTTLGGRYDAFLFKFNSAGQRIWSTFYGGADDEDGNAVQVDLNGDIYIGGLSVSPTSISTPGSYQPAKTVGPAWQGDAFLAKFNSAGTRIWGTYLGGSASATPSDYITGIAVDNKNNVVVSGDTYCTDFPATSCAYQTHFVGSEDQFITSFDPNGKIICSGFLGLGNAASPNNETTNYGGGSIATFGGLVYLTATSICNYPVTPNAYQLTCGGSFEATIAQLCLSTCGLFNMTSNFSTNKTTICKGDPVNFTLQSTSCSQVNTTYQWSFQGATPSTSTAQHPNNITYNSSGSFAVKVLIITPCGKDSVIKNAYINVGGSLSASTSSTPATCGNADGTATAQGSGGNANYTYYWSNGSTTSSTSGLASGIYSVTVNDGTCPATTTVTISQAGGGITINSFNSGSVSCNGGNNGWASVNVGALNNITYLWSNASTTGSISNLSSAIYSVTVSDQNGCSKQGQINILQSTPITTTVNAIDATCNTPGSATINTSGGISPHLYNWSNGQTTSIANGLAAGIYSATVTDGNSCKQIANINIAGSSMPTATITNTTSVSCNGGSDGSAAINVSGGNGNYIYNWSNGQSNTTITNLSAGTYSVVITDAAACTTTASVTITQPPVLVISSIPTTSISCYGGSDGSASVIATGGNGNYTYLWSTGSTSTSLNNLTAGNYNITVTDSKGCTVTGTTSITEPGKLTLSSNYSATICAGQSTNINVLASAGTPNYIYSWNTGSNSSTITVSPTTNTSYSIRVTDNNGCTIDSTVLLNVNSLPVILFTSDKVEGCGPLCVTFTNTTSNTQMLAWDLGNGNNSNQQLTTNCYTTAGQYPATLSVTDNNGCSNTLTQNNYITVHPDPVASFAMNPNPANTNSTINFIDQSIGASAWNWNFTDASLAISNQQNPSCIYTKSGQYKVTLFVQNEFGCSDSTEETVEIIPDFSFYYPNTFTPNNDGINDIFIPINEGIESVEYQLYIYDRWGDLIFNTDDSSKGWNGKANDGNSIAQIDTYIWKLSCKDIIGNRHRYTGRINLIK